MSNPIYIQQIIEKHLALDTTYIAYHPESVDMTGRMTAEIMELVDQWIEDAVAEFQAGDDN